jgi:hypothetical protein
LVIDLRDKAHQTFLNLPILDNKHKDTIIEFN